MNSCGQSSVGSVTTTRYRVSRPNMGPRRAPDGVDALVVTALPAEHRATALAGLAGTGGHPGVAEWESYDPHGPTPYEIGRYLLTDGSTLRVALARATRPGCIAAAATASSLIERLHPRCLAMSGICAGNPAAVGLGDVVIADSAYVYDEGYQTVDGFAANHRQIPMRDDWVRAAQDLSLADDPPFRLAIGPMVSGNMVVKDGRVWQRLAARGGGYVVGLDMEAAAVAAIAYRLDLAWAVVKGVADHADSGKDDRYLWSASSAAAQVLWNLLVRQLASRRPPPLATPPSGRCRTARSRPCARRTGTGSPAAPRRRRAPGRPGRACPRWCR